ncbi:DUF397 domain-containing protein [Nocardiopsis sp. RSe5-2]|uniref:DUF397 domain-containing protein n=1 Tax=Nocardiopsis endophytica TaxID=3018445 RepID=A0ABT4UD14_9ACTN|nr:DUF397 domain-containing protein [Nocardiopsis endophytica]MDA2814863.1 DUF397 domain-containing protein [Nocardiopsis endophytica]
MNNPSDFTLAFRKSSYSDRDNCVEVADLSGGSAVRDSQHPERGHLLFSAAEWRAFLNEVKRDRL